MIYVTEPSPRVKKKTDNDDETLSGIMKHLKQWNNYAAFLIIFQAYHPKAFIRVYLTLVKFIDSLNAHISNVFR